MFRNRPLSRQAHAILAALLERPMEWRHGYDLAKLTGLSSGTLYPILIRLNERELLEARWIEAERPGRPPRHAYRLTSGGLVQARTLSATAATTAARPSKEALA